MRSLLHSYSHIECASRGIIPPFQHHTPHLFVHAGRALSRLTAVVHVSLSSAEINHLLGECGCPKSAPSVLILSGPAVFVEAQLDSLVTAATVIAVCETHSHFQLVVLAQGETHEVCVTSAVLEDALSAVADSTPGCVTFELNA